MKFIIATCLISIVIAEPPVSDTYIPPKSPRDHGIVSASQRSISQEYGLPQLFRRRNTLTEYGPPKSGTKPSAVYAVPTSRLSQDYGLPDTRSSLSSIPLEYGVPEYQNAPSEVYGVPNSKSSIQNYFSYETNRSPSSQYGLPSRSLNVAGSTQKPILRSQLSSKHKPTNEHVSSSRTNDFSENYATNSQKSYPSRNLQQNYGAAKTGLYNAPLPTSYGVPDSVVTSDYSQDVKSVSQTYDGPSASDLTEAYEASSARSSFEQSSKAAGSKTKAISSSYNFGRSSPSASYGVPSIRDSMPSDQYGIPDEYTLTNNDYVYSSDSLHENEEEPASYDFGYKVIDYISGSDFGHTESRQDNRAEGTYFVVLPDGNKQVVEYEADEGGFKPRISVEPVEDGSNGYDDNAADLIRSEYGPY